VILCDVNVLLQAYRSDLSDHVRWQDWLERQLNSDEAFGISPLVLSAFTRIVTNRRAFVQPESIGSALAFCDSLVSLPQAVVVTEGPRHWRLFTGLCRKVEAKGNLVPDAYLAALAIEHGATLCSRDVDFSRFAGLRWIDPLRD
jgi:toxin-antitoxin system PIN domain toxin